MDPKTLKTPARDLVLTRFTDFTDHSLARFRLWRMPPGVSVGAGATLADFSAPSDGQAEQLVQAWHGGLRLVVNSANLDWYHALSDIEEEKKAVYQEALRGGDREELRVALQEFLDAENRATLLRQAFVGEWPTLR